MSDMMNGKRLLLVGAALLAGAGLLRAETGPAEGLTAVPFQEVHISGAFWGPRIKTNRKATVEANLRQCEITGRIKNFAVCGKLEEGKHQGELYNDSDV